MSSERLARQGVLLLAENSGLGGINSYVVALAEGIQGLGIPVDIAAVWPKEDNWLDVQCGMRRLPLAVLARSRSIRELPRAVIRLARRLKHRRYALVHTQAHYSGLVA